MTMKKVVLILIPILMLVLNLNAQEGRPPADNLQDQAPKVFIDGQGMDMR